MEVLNLRKRTLIVFGFVLFPLGVVVALCLILGRGIIGHTTEISSEISIEASSLAVPHVYSNLNDPYVSQQWTLDKIHADQLRQTIGGSPDIIVGVLDTGIDRYHEDLSGSVIAEANFTDSPTSEDVNGHGTHVAGIIAAHTDNNLGIAGLTSGTHLLNVKVADDLGKFKAQSVSNGIVWAVDNGAKVINISLARIEYSESMKDAIEYAWNRGVLIIAAAGNDNSNIMVYPAAYDHVVSVAALNIFDTLAPLSNSGDWIDVSAPGMNIYSALPNNKYGFKTGTSFAAATVSGLAASLFNSTSDQNGDGCVNDEVRSIIENGCRKISLSGIGRGCVDAYGSLLLLNVPGK